MREVSHVINEHPGSKPVHKSPYRLSPAETTVVEENFKLEKVVPTT
jgi:hypothetical protein